MSKRLLGCFLLFGLIFGSFALNPTDSLAKKSKRSSSSKSSRSKKTTKSTRSNKNRSNKQTARSNKRTKNSRVARRNATRQRRNSGLPASAIPPERVREIQTALQREGYLQSEPTGQYDRATVDAMTSYQKANNMRSTGYPTAESLQRLGLSRQRRVNPPATPGENRPESNTTGSQSSSQLRDQ